MTHEAEWDPEVLDNELSDEQDWFDSLPETPLLFPLFDKQGMLHPRVMALQHDVHTMSQESDDPTLSVLGDGCDMDESTDQCVYYANLHRMVPIDQPDISVNGSEVTNAGISPSHVQVHKACLVSPSKVDYEALRSRFAWLPADIIQKTFSSTTQYARMPYNTVLRHHYKVPQPALNHFRREEPVATDTIVSDTPAIDGGKTWAQLFVGTKSLLSGAYRMKTPANFSSTLMDNNTQ